MYTMKIAFCLGWKLPRSGWLDVGINGEKKKGGGGGWPYTAPKNSKLQENKFKHVLFYNFAINCLVPRNDEIAEL